MFDKGEDKYSRKADVFWNTIAVSADALQSTVILSVIAYKLGIEDAGIFSIGYALANLAATIARYGMRNYQVTDKKAGCIFSDYFFARIITVFSSLACVSGYLMFCRRFLRYEGYKTQVVFMICLYKLTDALEDVCIGYYQQQGKLFAGARIAAIRMISSTGILCAVLLAAKNLVTALEISVIYSVLLDVVLFGRRFRKEKMSCTGLCGKNVKKILRECAPLAIAASVSMYVGNIPKYMIDWYMTEDVQAIFGYLMMPAFCIVLLSRFVYQPMVRDIGILWQKKEKKKLKQLMERQVIFIFCVTAIAVLAGTWIGIPLLNLLYDVRLEPYRLEFTLLFLGGALFAISSFCAVMLTVTGRRNEMAAVYLLISLCSCFGGKYLLELYGIAGAAILYLILNLGIILCFLLVLRKDLYEEKK
ncbi:hypothetical protein E5329_09970 [Petralouisia muris]|uniref:Uncharacterized protein n=1 Tax=Petralouisia muris TaxID=3032872 RepID=A0AC61RWM6_9FIRM|nr:hypothetical protein [Petralouisia muris]TGY96348.1 hypothetical protein E5329_09970 [Petralouisia muris]